MRAILLPVLLSITLNTFAQDQKIVIDKVIAIVGDKIILQSDITTQKQSANGSSDEDCMFIEQAMISKILMVGAEKDSLPVTDEYVEEYLDRQLAVFFKQAAADTVGCGKTVTLADIQRMKKEALPSAKEQMLAQAMKEKIIENVKITPSEVESFFNKIPKDKLPIIDFDLQSRNAAKHTMNLTDDYEKVAALALDQKRMEAFDSWFVKNLSRIYIEVDDDTQSKCDEVKKFISPQVASN